jgi:hypothetical protein
MIGGRDGFPASLQANQSAPLADKTYMVVSARALIFDRDALQHRPASGRCAGDLPRRLPTHRPRP